MFTGSSKSKDKWVVKAGRYVYRIVSELTS